jgi:hypothetical protein
VSRAIGTLISSGKVSMRDLGEWMSLQDAYDVLEVISVDAHNRRLLQPETED